MIPEDKKTAVCRALREAFGATDVDDIRKMTRGLSSDLVFRVVVQANPYLLRIMTRTDEINDPNRIFTCMKAAAEAGLAPCVHYASAEDGVAIIDWIDTAPLSLTEAYVHFPPTLRALHSLAPFPKTFNYITAHKFFVWRLRTTGLLREEEAEPVFRRYAQLCATYPRVDDDLVSCHMDLKPDNVLYDGRRLWLMDWTAAHRNDRYFDLAMVANFVVLSDADERTYLERYFGHPPDAYQLARFFLMRQAFHMLSAAVFLLLGSAGKPIPQNTDVPSFRDFHERIWAGEVDLSDNAAKLAYGRVHWAQLLENTQDARFEQALRLIAERNAQSDHLVLLLPSDA
jgi:hypothetical protein